jgi:protein-S-isoprenylcysteine O-methyltransferase Ste14
VIGLRHRLPTLDSLPPLCVVVRVLITWHGGRLFARELARCLQDRRLAEAVVLVAGTGSLLVDIAYELRSKRRVGSLGLPPAVRACGLLLFVAGSVVELQARRVLGLAWTVRMTPQPGASLVSRGPYAVVRHPIYAGSIASYSGLLIGQNDAIGLLTFGAQIVGYFLKAAAEDRLLARRLGPVYGDYRRDVPHGLVPGFWSLR